MSHGYSLKDPSHFEYDNQTATCNVCYKNVKLIDSSDYECSSCFVFICDDCWETADVCYYPGDGYCSTCLSAIIMCPICCKYMKNVMDTDEFEPCEKFPHRELIFRTKK